MNLQGKVISVIYRTFGPLSEVVDDCEIGAAYVVFMDMDCMCYCCLFGQRQPRAPTVFVEANTTSFSRLRSTCVHAICIVPSTNTHTHTLVLYRIECAQYHTVDCFYTRFTRE